MKDIARRSINKVTYAPIQPSTEDVRSGAVLQRQRGLDKIVYANSLRATAAEIQAVKDSLNTRTQGDTIAALDAIREVTARGGTARSGWRNLSKTPAAALAAAGRALADHRCKQRTQLRDAAKKLADDHSTFVRAKLEKSASLPAPATRASSASIARTAPGGTVTAGAAPWTPAPGQDPRISAASLKPTFAAAIDWARVNDPSRADALATLAHGVAGLTIDLSHLSVLDWDHVTDTVVSTSEDTPEWTDDLTDGFEERMKVEPIGRLHLERIDMTPVGVVRGELLHSVGLAPAETVTLIHREWSSRETSFEKVVTDEFEQSTEEGVTENTELASATETQSRHSSALSMEASGSGSWGFASASTSIGYNSTSDNENSKRDSRNHAIGVTRKASSRTRKEHKDTFTVKEQSGVEDQSVRTLTNSSPNEPMRVDFHQMVRDWKVDLYRYGLRLTYDIVVPAPGIDLLANVDELRRIEHQLGQPFAFTLAPSDITRENWSTLAARYNAELDPPDPEVLRLTRKLAYPPQSEDEAKNPRFDTLDFDLPVGYYVRVSTFQAFFTLYTGGHFDVMDDLAAPIGHNGPEVRSYICALEQLTGCTGQLSVVMYCNGLQSGYATATVEAIQHDEGWKAWQTRAWTDMRKGAEEQWQMQRQDLQQLRDQLNEALGKWDPLTLRRMEREEIMKTTLKWIFGPSFDLMPSEVARQYAGNSGGLSTLEPSKLTVEQWAQAMGLGEFIKFMHQAIEWENVLFFIYPYFWDNPNNHALKRFLQHPDNPHQTFLRGGAARVVLTVRPGFEESFTRLFETGNLDDELGPNHPYLTIAEEIRAYADTHYPGIPGATPNGAPDAEAVESAERGEHIAQWHEFTPVSAIDITVNTPLDELK